MCLLKNLVPDSIEPSRSLWMFLPTFHFLRFRAYPAHSSTSRGWSEFRSTYYIWDYPLWIWGRIEPERCSLSSICVKITSSLLFPRDEVTIFSFIFLSFLFLVYCHKTSQSWSIFFRRCVLNFFWTIFTDFLIVYLLYGQSNETLPTKTIYQFVLVISNLKIFSCKWNYSIYEIDGYNLVRGSYWIISYEWVNEPDNFDYHFMVFDYILLLD